MAVNEEEKLRALWRTQLQAGLEALEIEADDQQMRQLIDYLALLLKWNKAFNLTAIRSPSQMVSRQLLDSLSILTLVKGPNVLDVGTGAGLPGIPLAIMRPYLSFVLLDSNGKKARFVNQARLELKLDNLQVVHDRVESYQAPEPFQTITSRAFASLDDMLRSSKHLLANGGQWLAMKGQKPTSETKLLKGYEIHVVPLIVPNETGQRHAVLIHR